LGPPQDLEDRQSVSEDQGTCFGGVEGGFETKKKEGKRGKEGKKEEKKKKKRKKGRLK